MLYTIRTMNIHQYIGSGVVFRRLNNVLTNTELMEFNVMADLHPELREELVFAYNLLTELSASYPPHEVTFRFREFYNGHLQRYRQSNIASMAVTETEDWSGKYLILHKNYKLLMIGYLVFLAITACTTVYFYMKLSQ